MKTWNWYLNTWYLRYRTSSVYLDFLKYKCLISKPIHKIILIEKKPNFIRISNCIIQNFDESVVKKDGFFGDQCEIAPCANTPCRNNATCNPQSATKFECICTEGFIGPTCEVTDNSVCKNVSCSERGICKSNSMGGYICVCDGKSYSNIYKKNLKRIYNFISNFFWKTEI